MNRRQFMTLATITFVAGCTGGGDNGAGTSPTPSQTEASMGSSPGTSPTESQADATVVVENTKFQTLKAEVPTGATVKWVNEDDVSHDVTAAQFHDSAADWSLSQTLSGGQSTTYTFDSEGIYEYYCTIHGQGTMCGAVLVGGATLEESLPCGDGGDGGGGGAYY